MKIGIIGAGNAGGTLGAGWRRKGHDVMFGARDLADPKLQTLLKQTGAQAGTVQQAAAFGDVVVLTVPFAAAEDAIRTAGRLGGKILLDCTNPMSSPQAAPQNTPSGAEQVAKWAGGARVVTEALTMFYAGDDSAAKATAAQLAADLGFDPIDGGPLPNARFLEALASFWVTLAYSQKLGRDIGFRLLRR
jgi:8-hydroxy-5-deazaflavin:NADPH oxidoreductase